MKDLKRKRISAGILFYRAGDNELEFMIVHPGGPLFSKKDNGCWSIPKGEPDDKDESLLATAIRETKEETGIIVEGALIPLGSIIQKGGKQVYAWGCLYNAKGNPVINSNLFEMEWPPKSGSVKQFPEIDKAEFFNYANACKKIKETQIDFLDRLIHLTINN